MGGEKLKPLINANGITREMTDKEYAEFITDAEEAAKHPKPQPSPEQRIAELEAQLAALTAGYAEGVNQA